MITEQQYPIQKRWLYSRWVGLVFRTIPAALFIGIFVFVGFFVTTDGQNLGSAFLFFIVLIVANAIISVVQDILTRANFHYALEEEFLTVKTGIIAKTEQHIPYSTMQNIFLTRRFWDQFFHLSNITVENASRGAAQTTYMPNYPAAGNEIFIPGLDVKDAEELKKALVVKINEYKKSDTTSGL